MTQSLIHPTAIIDDTAVIGENVHIGPYAIIGPGVVMGNHCQIGAHAIIEKYTTLGDNCHIASKAIIGGDPQDYSYKGETSRLMIGNNVHVREFTTIHRPVGEGNTTSIGDNSLIMGACHIAHNCQIGENVTMTNLAQLAGHVTIGDYCVIGGMSAIHQHVRVGRMVMLGAYSGTREDLPPFSIVDSMRPTLIRGLNKVGLKRRGLSVDDRLALKKAFQKLFFSDMNVTQALDNIAADSISSNVYVQELVTFMQTSKRSVLTTTIRRLQASGNIYQLEPDELELMAEQTQDHEKNAAVLS